MAADSTLVNAAFKLGKTEAGANVPNMAPLMKAQVGISAGFTKMARDAMSNHQKKKEIERVGKSKQLGVFEKVFTDTLTKLYEQEEPLPDEFIDAVTARVESLQEEFEAFNTYGKGDTSVNNRERARIMGELKRVTNEVVNFRGGLQKFAVDRENGLLNEGECSESNIAPAQQAIDMRNFSKNAAEGKVEVGYGEDGKLQIISRNYYSSGGGVEAGGSTWGDDVIVNIESLEKYFPPKDTKQDASILASLTESGNTGKVDGLKPNPVSNYDRAQRRSEYLDSFKTDKDISNIVSRKIEGVEGNHPSFKDALLSDINIPLSILDNMFYEAVDNDGKPIRVEVGLLFKDLDIDGVDGINQKDYDLAEKLGGDAFKDFETNLDAMIDVITNVNNELFDRTTTAGLLADYLTSMDEEKYNTNFNIAKKSKEKVNDKNNQQNIVLGTYRTYSEQDAVLDKATRGEPINDWAGNEWVPDPDIPGNYKYDDETSYPLSKLLKGPQFGMTERIDQRKLDYSEKVEFETYDPEAEGLGTINEPYKHSVLGPISPVKFKWYHMNAQGTLPMMWDGKKYITKEEAPISPK
tara:strand:- start:4865 stop:6601 length:1737 start_codon:yes stop_codon:yes gene_type:complete